MRRPVIILARTLAYFETRELAPRGGVYFPDLVKEIALKYQFLKFPQTIEELDITKGVEFLEGRLGQRGILKFVIWENLLVLETRSNTRDSKELLEEILQWGVEKFGLEYKPENISHFAYVSDVTFYSDAPILAVNAAVSRTAAAVGNLLSEIWKEPIVYQPAILHISHDPLSRKYGIAPFSIERRGNHRFSENKYYSEAPLPTDTHLSLLEQFESDSLSLGTDE